jgi:hypothetical protein
MMKIAYYWTSISLLCPRDFTALTTIIRNALAKHFTDPVRILSKGKKTRARFLSLCAAENNRLKL